MTSHLRIAAIAGSLRKGSYNRMLLDVAVTALEAMKDVEIDRLDLRDFPLPPYDGDWEEAHGLPQEAWTLKARIAAAHGVVIAAPEYNGGVSGMFKNVLDWTSRGGASPWEGKVVGLMGATDGSWGTWRGQPHYRQSFTIMGSVVLPQSINVPHATKVWSEAGDLIDPKLAGRVEKFAQAFVAVTNKLRTT